jgi:hypothetical protein
MCGGQEAAHVEAAFGDDDLSCAPAHARDGLEAGQRLRERGDHPVHLGVELGDRLVQNVYPIEVHPCQEAVVLVEAPDESSPKLGDLRAHAGEGHLCEHNRVTFSGDERFDHVARRLAGDVGHDRVELHTGVLEHLLPALDLAGVLLDELLALGSTPS